MNDALRDRLKSDGPKRILSIDGGGIRGYLTLQILRKIEEVIKNRCGDDTRLCDYFDLIGGTSTGSILAAGLASGDFRRLGETYLGLLHGQAPGAPRITDKMPRNFFFLGLIRLALPGARIVHCTRNPVDTCLSCYQIHFPTGQEFTYDLTELGRYYRLYRRLMDHWRAVLGNRMFHIAYEDLVAAPENHMRALLDFAGLPWQDACLDFHKTERQIRTASAQQVRQPLYQTSVQRWRKYEKHLGPLFDALGPLAQDR